MKTIQLLFIFSIWLLLIAILFTINEKPNHPCSQFGMEAGQVTLIDKKAGKVTYICSDGEK